MRYRVLLIPAMLLFAFGLFAEAPMTQLNIEVRNTSDKPVDRAGVVVRFIEGRSVAKLGKHVRKTFEMRTNQEGIAKVPSIPQGKILIQVIAKGYQTYGKTYDVAEPEKTIEIKLNPPQAQYSAHED